MAYERERPMPGKYSARGFGGKMKDQLGLYYHPRPGDNRVRVYVRKGPDGEAQFRLWQADMPQIYEQHDWLPHDFIAQAAKLYQSERNPGANPLWMYDINVARELIKQDEKENPPPKSSGSADGVE